MSGTTEQQVEAGAVVATHGCWTSEYDWEILSSSKPQSRETVLCVLFDSGAQRQFSNVRITLLCSNDATPRHREAWQIIPCPPPMSVVNRVPSASPDRPQNDPPLPICNIVYRVDRHSARPQTTSNEANVCGEIVLGDAESFTDSNTTIFEFGQPLTENTQSVSVSFTSSHLLRSQITHGVFSDPLSDHSSTVGRVVRVLPADPMRERKPNPIPTEVLLVVFENLRFPLEYRKWRKDVVSCALVCREWTCALGVLLIDFRSEVTQRGYPPEIASFASGLRAHPSLALDIKYLSVGYLEEHPSWNPRPDYYRDHRSSMPLAMLGLQRSKVRRAQFGKAFLSILSVAKNVQILFLDPVKDLFVSADDLADALRGLNRLEIFRGKCSFSMVQLASCVVTWPSLKHFSVLGVTPPDGDILPSAAPPCCLTVLELVNVPVRDDELAYLVSSSSSILKRLTLKRISELTNSGLAAVLNAVCTSLTYLYIKNRKLARKKGEEIALDATISKMERLTMLKIVPALASERMIERRAEAFKEPTTLSLPEVHLHLIACGTENSGLVAAANRAWPGWQMKVGSISEDL